MRVLAEVAATDRALAPHPHVTVCLQAPFYDADMDWAQDAAAPRIGNAVKAAAASRGAEVLELLHAFAGHEFCAETSSAVSLLAPPSPVGSEWGRAVSPGTTAQGQIQELFHPNAYGEMALGTCVGALYAARRGSYACTGGPARPGRDAADGTALTARGSTAPAGRSAARRRSAA